MNPLCCVEGHTHLLLGIMENDKVPQNHGYTGFVTLVFFLFFPFFNERVVGAMGEGIKYSN